jgi:hypothetical protein
MISSDEDFTLFLEEVANLLTKYHYKISNFTVGRLVDPEVVCIGFKSLDDNRTVTPLFLEKQYIKYKDE